LLSKQQENVQFYLSKPVDIRPFSCFWGKSLWKI
jgi:hypothetical protein